eukprot:2785602-Prymnesium_polylepis.1
MFGKLQPSQHLIISSNRHVIVMSASIISFSTRDKMPTAVEGRVGACGFTAFAQGHHCQPGDTQGSWSVRTFSRCASKCAACSRCHFVSFTPQNMSNWDSSSRPDCSWFAKCNMRKLLKLAGARTFAIRASNGSVRMEYQAMTAELAAKDLARERAERACRET